MKEENSLLEAIFEATVDAVVVADSKGKISHLNASTARMFGYEESELIGQNVKVLMHQDMAHQHDGFLDAYLNTGVNKIIGIGRNVEGRRKDGSSFPLHLSVGHAETKGKMIFVGIMHDLTQRRLSEKALARSQRLEAVGQMTGGIVHDFNNILTVIMGNLELLEMRGVDDTVQSLINDAVEATELGADLTARLMVFARQSVLSPEVLDVTDECERALSLLRRTLGARYKIKTSYTQEPARVSVDHARLQSALVNLAMNARDAMPEGGHLTLETENVGIDDAYIAQETDIVQGHYVRISLTDTGSGMTADEQRQAFEPFFTTKPSGKGTGLGLSMVYGFVRQSGGYVTLYSEPGFGTTVSLYFPVLPEDVPAVDKRTVSAPAPYRGNGEIVLVVEDNEQILSLSVQRVQHLGFSTVTAPNAQDAIDLLKTRNDISIVFSDVIMPGDLTGFDLAEHVAATYPDIRILLTTGYADHGEHIDQTINQEFPILHKPYRQADLAEKFEALLSSS